MKIMNRGNIIADLVNLQPGNSDDFIVVSLENRSDIKSLPINQFTDVTKSEWRRGKA